MSLGLLQGVLDSLWQSLILVIITAVLLRLVGRVNAATRHAVWWIALVSVAALPFLAVDGWAPISRPNGAPGVDQTPAGGAPVRPPVLSILAPGRTSAVTTVALAPTTARLVVLGWLAAAVSLLVLLLVRLVALRAVVRRTGPLASTRRRTLERRMRAHGIGTGVELRVLDSLSSPVTIGLIWRVIVLPAPLVGRLSDDELLHVVAHEVAHLERCDDWSLLMQRALGAVWFFNPVVHWLGRRMELERELACDDWVLVKTGAVGTAYATTLACVGEFALLRPQTIAPAVTLALDSQLRQRVERLLRRPVHRWPRVDRMRCVILATGVGIAAFLLAGLPSLARLQAAEPSAAIRGVSSSGPVAAALADLASPSARVRAESAYWLGQRRGASVPAVSALLGLLDDDEPVPRVAGRTSRVWGRPPERADTTSPAEEAIKALLYVGRPALAPFEAAVAGADLAPDHLAVWALELLRDFD